MLRRFKVVFGAADLRKRGLVRRREFRGKERIEKRHGTGNTIGLGKLGALFSSILEDFLECVKSLKGARSTCRTDACGGARIGGRGRTRIARTCARSCGIFISHVKCVDFFKEILWTGTFSFSIRSIIKEPSTSAANGKLLCHHLTFCCISVG